jgi:hypothetical protein
MKHDTAIEAARIEARRQWAEVPETNDADVIGHACDVGFLAGYEAGKPSWVAIETADDLPKENGWYIWRGKVNGLPFHKLTYLCEMYDLENEEEREWTVKHFSHWMPIPPAPGGGDDND